MEKLIHQLEQYLLETLGISVASELWEKSCELPQFLRERYSFFKMNILSIGCLLMVDFGEEEQTPAVIAKQLDQVRARSGFETVYVRQAVTSYIRKRLIDQKAPFIVPGNQLYLPMLGVDLREYLKRMRKKRPIFSPSTQVLIMHVLWRKETDVMTPADIAHRLGYSAMTMTRAFDELETAGIGEFLVSGKERHLHFTEMGKLLWGKVLPFLGTPVRKRLYVAPFSQMENGSLGGQSALSRYTMLAEPMVPVFAFSAAEWKARMLQIPIVALPASEPGAFEIELWKYNPTLFAREGNVDRLSLYLSLRASADERVQAALDALLAGMEW